MYTQITRRNETFFDCQSEIIYDINRARVKNRFLQNSKRTKFPFDLIKCDRTLELVWRSGKDDVIDLNAILYQIYFHILERMKLYM